MVIAAKCCQQREVDIGAIENKNRIGAVQHKLLKSDFNFL